MAKKKITNISSGIYSTETDLTIVQQSAGTFAGACIGLMEKGPAFAIMTSADFDERRVRLGDLNPNFKSSYAAYEFLEQADNYKEVRILGLEGYNEDINMSGNDNVGGYDKGFAILYDLAGVETAGSILTITDVVTDGSTTVVITAEGDLSDNAFIDGDTVIISGIGGVTSANGLFTVANVTPGVGIVEFEITVAAGTSDAWSGGGVVQNRRPIKASQESIACILKPRRTSFTQYAEVDYVEVGSVLQSDSTTAATDDIFKLTIYYKGDQSVYEPVIVKCSLRPESNQYITKIFGTDPRDNTKLQGGVPPLWVEFIWPSTKHKIVTAGYSGHYYPGDVPIVGDLGYTRDQGYLELAVGNITFQKNYSYPSYNVADVTDVGADTLFETDTDHGFIVDQLITLSNINGVLVGTLPVNGNWYVSDVPSSTTFTIKDVNGVTPVTSGSYTSGGSTKLTFVPTWEKEVMDLGGAGDEIDFQTAITPWFISDFDENAEVKRLFRIWSISDGEAANTEIKIELANINPAGNLNKGSFDILVRVFDDTDDKERKVYEAFANLTLDPKSPNYILKRIGDGENFEILSSFIFVEINENETIPDNALPYGVEGYPLLNGLSVPDLLWASTYDLTKPITKQMLGLANNSTNMLKEVTNDNLSFKNLISYDAAVGRGFHLNPQMIDDTNPLYSILSAKYVLVNKGAYYISTTNTTAVTGLDKTKRMKFASCFFGGFDGWNVYSERTWVDTTSKDYEAYMQALAILNDSESLEADFSVLVTPDINFENHPNVSEETLNMCENDRGDALYIFDFDYGYFTGIYPEIVPTNAKIALDSSNMKSSFAATYYPDWQFEDKVNNINVWVPPSILAIATIAATATNENVFQPPAGSLRTVTDNLVRTRQRMKLPDREVLKSANINPITVFPGSGYEITESRTTQEVLSARSFIHNRLLLGYAKKALNQTLRPILQQLNTGISLQDAFINAVEPIFDRIKRENGLEDFVLSVDTDPNDRTTLYGKIEIVPLYPIERIILDFTLVNGTLNFNQ